MGVPLVVDISSDFLTQPVDWQRVDLVYGGVQKNLGPAGLAVVVIRRSALDECAAGLPSYLGYAGHAAAGSLLNTPPMFSVYVVGKMLGWIQERGGLAGMAERASRRSGHVYDVIDSSDGFYTGPAQLDSRSRTNVVFRLSSPDLDSQIPGRGARGPSGELEGSSQCRRLSRQHLQRHAGRGGGGARRVHARLRQERRMTSTHQVTRPLVHSVTAHIVAPQWAPRVVSPLHDVLSETERRAILTDNPDSYLHVTSDPLALPERPGDGPAESVQAMALRRLLDLGAYTPVPGPAVFVYRMSDRGREHTGVIASVDVAGFSDGRVLGHEAVQPERVAGLVRHYEQVTKRSELVALFHPVDPRVAELTARVVGQSPLLTFTDASGVEQSVWQADTRGGCGSGPGAGQAPAVRRRRAPSPLGRHPVLGA